MDTNNTSPNAAPALVLATEAAQFIASVIPGLGQYGIAIDLGFAIVQKVAPAAYEEIKDLLVTIGAGGEPSDADKERLAKLVAALVSPENYFQTKMEQAKGEAVAESQATPKAEAAFVPADQQPGFCE